MLKNTWKSTFDKNVLVTDDSKVIADGSYVNDHVTHEFTGVEATLKAIDVRTENCSGSTCRFVSGNWSY